MSFFSWIYMLAMVGLSIFGFNMLLLVILALWHRLPRLAVLRPEAVADRPAHEWPTVTVQLPIYNERYVVERLIDAAAALDYPADRLLIQVLDDSTDITSAIARRRVAYHWARGRPVMYLHRSNREGFKAGALATGLARTTSEFIAVLDADFLPPPDFLYRVMDVFMADPALGMVQTRWTHLNAEQSLLTRAEALALDCHYVVEQYARSRSGLIFNFNGSAGVWRREAIETAGGWQGDTIVEDLDLSYRAQLAGWKMAYRPEIAVPAELTPSVIAFKRQQFRWAKGSFQVLRKLGWRVLTQRMPWYRRLAGILHLAGYFPHPLMVVALLASLPVVLLHGQTPPSLGLVGLAGFGFPLAAAVAQMALYKDWPRRLMYFPVLALLGTGLALSNAQAAWEAFLGGRHEFMRTPKLATAAQRESIYALPLDWTTWGELFLAVYAATTAVLAIELAPHMVPFLVMYAVGFGYISVLGLWQWLASAYSRETTKSTVE